VATEVKKRNNRVLVIIGAVLAVAAFGLSIYLSQRNTGGAAAPGGSSAPLVSAVVANTTIPKDTKITADELTVKQLPADQVPEGSPVDTTALVGKFVSIDVKANQVVQTSWIFADAGSATAAVAVTPPLDLHAGNVALSMPVSGSGPQFSVDAFTVGGFIHDDDRVDIIIDAGNGTTRYAFQDIRILHVGASGAAAVAPTVYIVEVSRADAEMLTYLTTNRGPQTMLRYVLRAKDDAGKGYQPATATNVKPAADPLVSADSFSKLFPAK
jgi:Flp pilus assembly protein CpaB